MIIERRILLFLLLFPSALLASEWSKEDKEREVVWLGLHVVDCNQALKIARNPDEFYEVNPLLGRHPSKGRVQAFCVLGAIVHPLAANHLSTDNRKSFQNWSIGITAGAVVYNYHIGLR